MKKILSCVMSYILLFSSPAYSGNCVPSPLACSPLNLQQTPIILTNTSNIPNVMIVLDNSSSMSGTKWNTARAVIPQIIDAYPNFRYGFELIHDNANRDSPTKVTASFVPLPTATADLATQNTLVKNKVTASVIKSGTPNRSALLRIGNYYQGLLTGLSSPVLSKCQKNYVVFITDGQWDGGDVTAAQLGNVTSNSNTSVKVGNVDKDRNTLFMSDIARYFYVHNLNTAVQGPDTSTGNTYDATFDDPAWKQNMRMFGISVESDTTLTAGTNGWPITIPAYPAGISSASWGSNKMDDLWHAAYNTQGALVNANPVSTLLQKLGVIMQNITAVSYSAVPVAQNSTVLNTGATIYQSYFDSTDWTGNVFAFSINGTGFISPTPNWSASCMLNGGTCTNAPGPNTGKNYANRVIISRDWFLNKGMAFTWPSDYVGANHTKYVSNSRMTNFLTSAPNPYNTTTASLITVNDTYGKNLVNYLRGDSSKDSAHGGTFRTRTSILGDIIDSSPAYVPAPNGAYPDTSESSPYSTFVANNSARVPMLYVGANDGMLHAFKADTGEELLAYVPGDNEIYKKLPMLSNVPYYHQFFVNATPAVRDAFFAGAWHTILATALGNGGRTISVLDVTTPSSFTEANANSIYLFEFSSVDNNDVGYIQGVPIITKVRKVGGGHQWAIIFGNGYNNAGSGKAALFILLIDPAITSKAGGNNVTWTANTSFIEIPVGTGNSSNPNGLSTPYVFDKDDDGVIDYVYAGDLQGNMWRFDLTDNSPTNWVSQYSLLFTAKQTNPGDQPITSPPVVGPHPSGLNNGVMVYFGTGKFLEPTDNVTSGTTTQTFYGIWDKLTTSSQTTPIVSKTALLSQTILGTTSNSFGAYRLLSSNAINWTTQLGWYLDLFDTSQTQNYGERDISTPILRNNRVIFTTLIPPISDINASCDAPTHGTSWLMEVNYETGGTPAVATFDVNGDGNFNNSDTITVSGNSGFAGGYKSTVGMTGSPTIFTSSDGKSETKVLSGAGLGTVKENPQAPHSPSGRRQNWRQVFY